ncbi:Calx-beta domain-containing protein [Methylocucumis oryzae]|uniref:Calx-beta domain-containing protein n=1 Tax=Methylocucumis oryzae TaxID=1632867 RepID=A0A0F3IF68_9GAMM|nr:Calx-beta domain-containing protein [Methylocucumis oryzae]KJV05406.1 hypothetical protein VZ94_18370 [Methylocucumis oryzae]
MRAQKWRVFVITLDKPSANAVSLTYSTQNGSAEAGSDFVASSGSLSFAPGETAKTVTVTLINDNLAETAEAFNLVLSNLVGATALDLTGTAIIAANDKTPISVSALSINDIVVGESQTYADFTISLDAPNTDTVTVSYQTQNGTAIFNNDGFGTSGKLTFAPGEVVKTVRVTLNNDTQAEVSENFGLVLFTPSSNATIVRNSGLATIIDNDAATGTPVVSISDLVLDEASGQASFAVTLDKPSTSVVAMNFTTQNGSAKAGSDFTSTSGALTFAPGETAKTITVFIQNDSLAENDEDFSVVLSNLSGATVLDTVGQAIIAANDSTPGTISNILIDDIVVGESQTYAEFTIRLDTPNTTNVTVNYNTTNGTAIFNNDAIGVTNALTFLPGETVKTVLVTLVNDTAQEITENFSLQLFSASANATIAKNVATATIIDNDAASGTPTVSINDYTIDESTREARFVITLDKPSTQVVSLDYATQNTSAKAGEDFVASSGSLSFAPGETVKTVSVALINDAVFEIAESFNLVLSNLVNATALDVVGTVVIAENDAPSVTVSTISVDDIVVGESQTFADFEVRLSAPNTDLVKVSYQTQNGTAVFNNDGVGVSGVLNFAPGETVKLVRVLLNNDTQVESAENFSLVLFNPSNATIVKSEATATIIDNDSTSGTPLAVISDVVLDESARTAQFVVTLDKPATSVVSMAYATQDDSAKAGADYVAQSGVIHFTPGETAKTVTVFLNNDTVTESDESFNMVLSELSGVTMLDNTGTAIIAANDSSAVTKSTISVESITVDEGDIYATFVARLDQPNNATITVNYTTTNGTAIFNNDAIAENSQLVFLPGETVKTIAIKLIDDTTVEAIESFNLPLFSPSANVTIAKPVAIATIIDNDAVSGTPVLSFSDTVIDETTSLIYVNASLDKPSTATVSADFILQNATADNGDYFSYPSVIAFKPGEVVKRVAIGINNDSLAEATEVFTIAVTNVTGASLNANGLTPIAIYDNDKTPVTSSTISMSNVTVVEDQGYAELLVTLNAPNTDTVTVNYQTSNGSAVFNNDGISTSGQLNFAAGETVKTIRIILTDDILTEASETFYRLPIYCQC